MNQQYICRAVFAVMPLTALLLFPLLWPLDGLAQTISRMENGKIAFVDRQYENRHPGIFSMNADGSGQSQLTFSSTDSYPAWSQDGKQISFLRSLPGFTQDVEIFVMNA